VRLEIAIALRRGIPVIPALWGKAELPPASRLPDDIAALAGKQGIPLRHSSFAADAAALAFAIERLVPHQNPPDH
jgi:hypothetical protein